MCARGATACALLNHACVHLLQCEALSKVLPPPAPSANGAAMDSDDVEDVSLRSIEDMAAENQRRCGQKCWPPRSEPPRVCPRSC